MKIINKNLYSVMYGMEFIRPEEIKDVDDKTAKMLLGITGIEEFIAVEDAKKLEEENEELKRKVALAEAKNEANELGLSYAKNISLEKLLQKIAAFKNAE